VPDRSAQAAATPASQVTTPVPRACRRLRMYALGWSTAWPLTGAAQGHAPLTAAD
jgi:hypothetical protein